MWIHSRIKQEEEIATRTENLKRNAPVVYDGLWKKIVEDIAIAKEHPHFRTMQPGTDGTEYQRIVYMPHSGGERVECRLIISEDNSHIKVTGAVEESFEIGLRADGTGFLSRNGNTVSYERAAQVILEPLLFHAT
ncbi:MAG TPA: hypothetical protein VGK48_10330 [Terriglobia bacterium]|jgi:hypothetical protein